MGSLYQNICYVDSASAADAFYVSSLPVQTVAIDGSSSFTYFRKIGTTWYSQVKTYDPAGIMVTQNTHTLGVISFPVCDPLAGFNDGLYVGGMLLLAVISAVIFGIISKAK